jgi:hypothetical protein
MTRALLAEEEGFEPPVPFRAQRFSSALPAATPAYGLRLIPQKQHLSGSGPGIRRVPSAPVHGQKADTRLQVVRRCTINGGSGGRRPRRNELVALHGFVPLFHLLPHPFRILGVLRVGKDSLAGDGGSLAN